MRPEIFIGFFLFLLPDLLFTIVGIFRRINADPAEQALFNGWIVNYSTVLCMSRTAEIKHLKKPKMERSISFQTSKLTRTHIRIFCKYQCDKLISCRSVYCVKYSIETLCQGRYRDSVTRTALTLFVLRTIQRPYLLV